MELQTLARYPFLDEAKQYIKENGPTVDELLQEFVYERARILGIERIEHLVTQRKLVSESMITQTDYIMHLLSYPIARMIAVCVQDAYFIKRYALGEAAHAYQLLLNEPSSFIVQVATELEVQVSYIPEKGFYVFFKDYLRNAPTKYKDWKLVNRTLDKGYVHMTQKVICRILLEVLRKKMTAELEQYSCHPYINSVFQQDIQRFQMQAAAKRKKIESAPMGKLNTAYLPPCLTHILAAVQSGENVAHMGRFALVAFLSSLKLSTQDIVKVFSSAPDFEEEKSRYQIEHISGSSSSTSYKSPGCDKMRTFGLCPREEMDDICKRIQHPLTYYSRKWRQEAKKK